MHRSCHKRSLTLFSMELMARTAFNAQYLAEAGRCQEDCFDLFEKFVEAMW